MAHVPCNGCTACCRGSANLTDKEAEVFETMTHHGGAIGTAVTDDGWCVYRIEGEGCAVYGNKPKFCDEYDCRDDVDKEYICRTVRDAARLRLERIEE